ncbi:MAG: hypothetical protein HC896_07365 [Bacteroidales bacterium]|nr:hypothetical protein [Bacteroidales bacterium]
MPAMLPKEVMLEFLVTFFFLFANNVAVLASDHYKPKTKNLFEHAWLWKEYPELNRMGFTCAGEDSCGNMWFGIKNGLLKYNGYLWHRLNQGNQVNKLERIGNSLFACTTSGVFKLGPDNWSKFFPKENIQWNTFDIHLSNSNEYWISGQHGLIKLGRKDSLLFSTKTYKDSILSMFPGHKVCEMPDTSVIEGYDSNFPLYIYDIAQDINQNFWFSLAYRDIVKLGYVNSKPAWSYGYNIYHYTHGKFIKDTAGSLITYSHDKIYALSNNTWKTHELSRFISSYISVQDISADAQGRLYASSYGTLGVFDKGSWNFLITMRFLFQAMRIYNFLYLPKALYGLVTETTKCLA